MSEKHGAGTARSQTPMRVWQFAFWGSLLACEALGLLLTYQA